MYAELNGFLQIAEELRVIDLEIPAQHRDEGIECSQYDG